MTYVDTLECPVIYHKWCCMSTVAACAQRKIWLDTVAGSNIPGSAHYRIAPNLYVILVGPPGIGKDTAMNVSRELLELVEGIPVKSDNLTKEYLYRFMATNIGMHKRVDTGKDYIHSSLTIFSSEMSTLIKKNDRDFVGMMNYMFNTMPVARNSTKNMGEDIVPNPFLNLLAGTTPDWINYNVRDDVLEGGFSARTIFVYAEQKAKINPFPAISPTQVEAKTRLIQDLKRIAAISREVHMNDESRATYAEWYNMHFQQAPLDYRMVGYHTRKPAFLLKLALLFALIRNPETTLVEPLDIVSSIVLLSETEPLIQKALAGVGRNILNTFAQRLLKQIHQAGGTIETVTLLENNRNDINKPEMDEILQVLVADGLIKPTIDDEKACLTLTDKGKSTLTRKQTALCRQSSSLH